MVDGEMLCPNFSFFFYFSTHRQSFATTLLSTQPNGENELQNNKATMVEMVCDQIIKRSLFYNILLVGPNVETSFVQSIHIFIVKYSFNKRWRKRRYFVNSCEMTRYTSGKCENVQK